MNNWTRKEFLKTTLIGGGAAFAATKLYGATAAKPGSANGAIRIAVVGVNAQGRGHMMDYAGGKLKPARLVAICDVDSKVLAERKAQAEKAGEADGIKVETYEDYRKLLENPNIDAVVLGTPNHQHSLQTIWALQAGKDVYVEKPLSHNVWEGRQAVEAAKKYTKNIVVAGTQNRSSEDIMEAIAYVRAGKLGKVQWARGTCYKTRDSIGKTTGPQQVPANINYDLWTGPAELTPPRRNGAKGPVHYDWHWFWNYGGGDITNQGIHQMDVARWLLGAQGLPKDVLSFGGRFGYVDDAETPNTLVSVFNYAEAPLIFEVRGLPRKTGMRAMDVYRASSIGAVLQCEGGYVHIAESGTGGIYDNSNKRIQGLTKGGNGQHRANFVKALQSRKVVNGIVDECHYSSALCHLGNLSYLVGAEKSTKDVEAAIKADANTKEAFGRALEHLKANDVNVETTKMTVGPLLKFDAKKEMFVGSEPFVKAANNHALRKREGRGAFKIPMIANGSVAYL
jgi:predicted dehydrogenase